MRPLLAPLALLPLSFGNLIGPIEPGNSRATTIKAASAGQDTSPLVAVRSKDPAQREAAARALASVDGAKAGTALIKLVEKDVDPLVVRAAIKALHLHASRADETPKGAIKALVGAALESPFASVQSEAAKTAVALDSTNARAAFVQKCSGKTFERAARSLALGYESQSAPPSIDDKLEKDTRKVERGVKSKDANERAAALRALVALTRGAGDLRKAALMRIDAELIQERRETGSVCAMLESVAAAPDPQDVDVLASILDHTDLTTVIERRLERALASALGAMDPKLRFERLTALAEDPNEPSGPRVARILGALEEGGGAALKLATGLALEGDERTRAAAAHALRKFGVAGSQAAVKALDDADGASTLLQLVGTVAAHGAIGTKNDKATGPAAHLAALLAGDDDPRVRSAAAIAIGRPGAHPNIVAALSRAAARSGDDIQTRIVATVALGRTRHTGAADTLIRVAGASNWRLRAAAAEGLKQLSISESVAPLLELLDDKNPSVRLTAHHALLRLAGRELREVAPETWPAWWEENLERASFRTREEDKERQAAYGYDIPDADIYRGLDVVVVPGDGDRVELVLDRLGIEYRTVQAGEISQSGLHPAALLLVGCTGQVAPDDLEVIRWFVASGGALFTSCWALTYTVEAAFPAIVSRFPSPGQVLDNVFARPTPEGLESSYLTGVFDGGVQPYYALQGAHLLHIVDPERVEVLLDSPSTAARHGSGDLAAWFRIGHGVVINSANHFEEQGLRVAPNLKNARERQAFAVNHMGYAPNELRKTKDMKWWNKNASAAEEVLDLSVFRILTNFARRKRIDG